MHLEDFFKKMSDQFTAELPFVAYRKPNSVEVKALFQLDNVLYKTDRFEDAGFVFSPFNSENDSILIPLNYSEVIVTKNESLVTVESSQNKFTSSKAQKTEHLSIVNKAIKSIGDTGLQKVIISRKETVAINDTQPIEIFKRLLSTYKTAFVYFWYHPKVGLWLGATPETLLKLDGHRFSSMALAGTQVYQDSLDVEWGSKEKEEQQLVTNFIENNLTPFSDALTVSDTLTSKAGNLLHLKTNISGLLKPAYGLTHLISALHPTPAICGLPREIAKIFILKNETYDRTFYAGFLGELNLETERSSRSSKRNIENRAYTIKRKQTELFVNLRCMQLQNKKAIIYVGGGITKDSISENEWEETVSKTVVMKTVL